MNPFRCPECGSTDDTERVDRETRDGEKKDLYLCENCTTLYAARYELVAVEEWEP